MVSCTKKSSMTQSMAVSNWKQCRIDDPYRCQRGSCWREKAKRKTRERTEKIWKSELHLHWALQLPLSFLVATHLTVITNIYDKMVSSFELLQYLISQDSSKTSFKRVVGTMVWWWQLLKVNTLGQRLPELFHLVRPTQCMYTVHLQQALTKNSHLEREGYKIVSSW